MRWWLIIAFLGAACSSSPGAGDAGDEDGVADAWQGDDGLGGWTLRFGAGLELCSWNAMPRTAPPYTPFDDKLRLSIRETSVRWPEDQERLEVELVERLEVSPDGAVAVPAGPGVMESRTYPGDRETWVSFGYTQEFTLDGEPALASFGFYLRDPEGTLDFDVAAVMGGEHNTCTLHSDQTEGRVTATAANGDVVVFDYRYILSFTCPPGMACLTPYGLGDPGRGEFSRGAEQRVVDSYFRLGLDCMHHGGPERFLMIFATPLDGVHGVTLTPPMTGGSQYELTYLDEDLAAAGTSKVVDLQWEDPDRQD